MEVRPSSEFAYESSRNKLANLDLHYENEPGVKLLIPGDIIGTEGVAASGRGFDGRHAQLLKLGGWIDLESRLTIGCAGALLSYLQRRRAAMFLPRDDAALSFFKISVLEMFSIKDTM